MSGIYDVKLPRSDFSRADFRPELFDALVMQKGYSVIWEQGMFCSCYIPNSGQPDYACPKCGGKGYVYIQPKTTKVIVTSINGHKEQERVGLDDKGTAYLTPLSTDNVGFRDRFTFIDSTTKYSQVLKKSSKNRLQYPVLDVIAVQTLSKDLRRGLDYTIEVDEDTGVSYVVWKDTAPIAEGEQFASLYVTHPVYVCINPIHELRGTYTMRQGQGKELYVPLSKQFQIKREDFLDGTELNINPMQSGGDY